MSGLGRGYGPTRATKVPLFGTWNERYAAMWEPLNKKVGSVNNDVIEIFKDSERLRKVNVILPKPKKLAFNEVHESGDRYRPFMEGRVSVGWLWWKRYVDVLVWRRAK